MDHGVNLPHTHANEERELLNRQQGVVAENLRAQSLGISASPPAGRVGCGASLVNGSVICASSRKRVRTPIGKIPELIDPNCTQQCALIRGESSTLALGLQFCGLTDTLDHFSGVRMRFGFLERCRRGTNDTHFAANRRGGRPKFPIRQGTLACRWRSSQACCLGAGFLSWLRFRCRDRIVIPDHYAIGKATAVSTETLRWRRESECFWSYSMWPRCGVSSPGKFAVTIMKRHEHPSAVRRQAKFGLLRTCSPASNSQYRARR